MLGSSSCSVRLVKVERFRSHVFLAPIMQQYSRSTRVQHSVVVEARMDEKPYLLPGYSILPEPFLLFAEGRTDRHPLRGLSNYGPYSSTLGFPAQVRLAYFAPDGFMRKLDELFLELTDYAEPKEATNYYVRYPSFQKVFRAPLIQPT